jgi:hypothetical protein
MTQPVLAKQSFLLALLSGLQALMPTLVAIATLYATITFSGTRFDPSSAAVVIAAVLCLILVQPPREVTTQLTSERVSAVVDVVFRWLLLLVVLLAVGYITKTLVAVPRRIFLTWAVVTPVFLSIVTLGMQEMMRRFLMSVFDNRSAVIAGYNNSSLELARRLQDNPAMRLEVSGFFDDRSADRLGMEAGTKLVGNLGDVAAYVKENGTDVIFIALPIRHVKRVMNLLDDLRDTTASIYYVPDIFVFDLIQARSGEIQGIPVVAMCETPFYGYRGVTKRPAAARADRRDGQAVLSRSHHFQTAPLWPGRRRDRGLQIPHHARHRRRRTDQAGDPLRQPHHAHRRTAAPIIDGRTASADQRPAGAHELGRSAAACGRPQRGISQAHQGLHGAPQGAAGHHRPRASQWMPGGDHAARGHGKAREFRLGLFAALVSAAGYQNHPADRRQGAARRSSVLSATPAVTNSWWNTYWPRMGSATRSSMLKRLVE